MLCDITVSKSDKISQNYQSTEFGYSITLKDVPESEVKRRSLELRLQVARFICNSEVIDGKRSPESAKEEINRLEQHLIDWRERNEPNKFRE